MISILFTIFSIVLLIANALLLFVIVEFSKTKRDTASKIGFGIMAGVYLANMIVIIGGMY